MWIFNCTPSLSLFKGLLYFTTALLFSSQFAHQTLGQFHLARTPCTATQGWSTHMWLVQSSAFIKSKVITLPLVSFLLFESSRPLENIIYDEYLILFNLDSAAIKLSTSLATSWHTTFVSFIVQALHDLNFWKYHINIVQYIIPKFL